MPKSLMIDRRSLVAGGLAMAALPGPAASQAPPAPSFNYPTQRIQITVPTAAGEVTDLFVRALLQLLSRSLNAVFHLTDMPAAGGATAAKAFTKATADGYTLFIGNQETLAIAPELHSRVDYKPLEEFVPVCGLCDVPLVVVVRRSLPAQNLRDLIDLTRNQPLRYHYGSNGIGSTSQMAAELLKLRAGLMAGHLPYATTPLLEQALVAEKVDFAVVPLAHVWQQVQAGRLKLFAQSGATRYKQLTNVPTLREAGVANADIEGWFGCFAPAATPPKVLDILSNAIKEALLTMPGKKILDMYGLIAAPRGPDTIDKLIVDEQRLFAELVRLNGLRTQ